MAYGRKYSKHGNSKVLRNTPPRQNRECDWCDGWEHVMGNGQWMCGKTHGQCPDTGGMNKRSSQGGKNKSMYDHIYKKIDRGRK